MAAVTECQGGPEPLSEQDDSHEVGDNSTLTNFPLKQMPHVDNVIYFIS